MAARAARPSRTTRTTRTRTGPDREADERTAVNEVLLRGRLAAPPDERVLPSGDSVLTFRLVVDRPAGLVAARAAASTRATARVDTLDCAVFPGGLRRRCGAWRAGDVVEIRGSLRRRFFRTGAGPASRYEVEVASASRVARAPA